MRINRKPNQIKVKTLTKLVLSKKLALALKISEPKAKPIIQSTVDALIALLTDGRSVMLMGIGVLSTKEKSERPGRNPKTGEAHLITARKVINFGHKANDKSRAGVNEICDIISVLSNVNHSTARMAFNVLLSSLTGVKDGSHSIEIRGLGRFYYTVNPPGLKRNPKTSKSVVCGERMHIKFKASKLLLDSINHKENWL